MERGLTASLLVIPAVLLREWRVNLRAYRVSFFVSTGLGSLFTLLIGYFLYHTVFAGRVTDEFVARAGTDDYVGYLTVGVIGYTFAVRLLYPVRNFLEEQWEGTLPVIVMMGMPRLPYHLGCILFSALYSALETSVLLLVVWWWLGVDLGAVHWGALVITLGAAFVGLYGFSLVLAAVILQVRDRVVVEGASFSLMMLLSGVLFPVTYLPVAAQVVAEAIPLTPALRALRSAALTGTGPAQLAPELLAAAGLGLVYLCIGKVLLDRALRRVLERSA